jgi:hypothetical protein
MSNGINELFSKAASYFSYYRDVLSTIPSPEVCDILKKEGWNFIPSEYADAIIYMPDSSGLGLPIQTVVTEKGTRVYKSNDPQIIKTYEDAKKRAAALTYGISK